MLTEDWVFTVTVQKLEKGENIKEPKLMRGKDEIEQYPDWDDKDDWDEEASYDD